MTRLGRLGGSFAVLVVVAIGCGSDGGRGGTGAAGAGGAGGTTGAAGTMGVAGRGGATGAAGSAGTSGGAGSGGSTGAGGASAGRGGTGGATCGGLAQVCCPPDGGGLGSCDMGLVCVDVGGGAPPRCASMTGAITYCGTYYIGGYDRMTIVKRDSGRNLCFQIALSQPGPAPSGLTLPSNWGLTPSSSGLVDCAPGGRVVLAASQVTGVLEFASSTSRLISADVVLTFGANDAGAPASERINATNLNPMAGCASP